MAGVESRAGPSRAKQQKIDEPLVCYEMLAGEYYSAVLRNLSSRCLRGRMLFAYRLGIVQGVNAPPLGSATRCLTEYSHTLPLRLAVSHWTVVRLLMDIVTLRLDLYRHSILFPLLSTLIILNLPFSATPNTNMLNLSLAAVWLYSLPMSVTNVPRKLPKMAHVSYERHTVTATNGMST